MDNFNLNRVLNHIEEEFKGLIHKGARHYLEISIGEHANKLGYVELTDGYKDTFAIVPIKAPRKGMKVRIDGRTFVNYAEYASGIAVPGYIAEAAGRSYKRFRPNDSMICNFN